MAQVLLVLAQRGRTNLMITYPIKDESGSLRAFEVDNVYIGVGGIRKLLSEKDGVSDLRARKLFAGGDDEFRLGFNYFGRSFLVVEPFGDNSRYWIGPENDSDEEAVLKAKSLENIFKNYEPPALIKILGDIVSLKFIKH